MNSKIRRLPPRSHLHGMICLAGHHRKSILFPGQLAICRLPRSALVLILTVLGIVVIAMFASVLGALGVALRGIR